MQMGTDTSFGNMLDNSSNVNMVNNYIQGNKQSATLDARQTGSEFFQEFKIGNYGKRETGMAPSIQMQNQMSGNGANGMNQQMSSIFSNEANQQ